MRLPSPFLCSPHRDELPSSTFPLTIPPSQRRPLAHLPGSRRHTYLPLLTSVHSALLSAGPYRKYGSGLSANLQHCSDLEPSGLLLLLPLLVFCVYHQEVLTSMSLHGSLPTTPSFHLPTHLSLIPIRNQFCTVWLPTPISSEKAHLF